jgi:hypothetical protein
MLVRRCVGTAPSTDPSDNSPDPDFAATIGIVHAAPERFLRALPFHPFDAARRAGRRLVTTDGDSAVPFPALRRP